MSKKPIIRVCIVYPTDPFGAISGGIDTFIRGMLRWAPEDFEIMLLGATTDPTTRPVKQWTTCKVGERTFQFFPLLSLTNPGKQERVPTSLTFTLAIARNREPVNADLFVYHGIEPVLAFLGDRRPKSAVIHQDMQVLRNPGADIRWRYLPWLYFGLERLLLPRFSSIFCVRQNAVVDYKKKYPEIMDRFLFTPTWVDTEVFGPPSVKKRRVGRDRLQTEFGFSESDHVLITVGRLNSQKNPMLLMDSLDKVIASNKDIRLLMVGEGQLRGEIESYASKRGFGDKVVLCGARTSSAVAEYLHGADTFVLSSAYEGMPMCVLEALGCGLPVVSTDVGEVDRVLQHRVNGEIVANQDAESFANAILHCMARSNQYRGEPCVTAIQDFTAQKVLAPIFENYRRSVGEIRHSS